MLVVSFHRIGGSSCTVHKPLHYSQKDIGLNIAKIDWKIIILGMVSALKYLHDHDILHNDIKADNILIDDRSSSYQCVVIDFSKVVLQLMEGHTLFPRSDVDICWYIHKLLLNFGMGIANNHSLVMYTQ